MPFSLPLFPAARVPAHACYVCAIRTSCPPFSSAISVTAPFCPPPCAPTNHYNSCMGKTHFPIFFALRRAWFSSWDRDSACGNIRHFLLGAKWLHSINALESVTKVRGTRKANRRRVRVFVVCPRPPVVCARPFAAKKPKGCLRCNGASLAHDALALASVAFVWPGERTRGCFSEFDSLLVELSPNKWHLFIGGVVAVCVCV